MEHIYSLTCSIIDNRCCAENQSAVNGKTAEKVTQWIAEETLPPTGLFKIGEDFSAQYTCDSGNNNYIPNALMRPNLYFLLLRLW